ncbi:hypothetical protein [Flavobacterium sp.]|uniref:hypothetical protein n=1 Tax=Flavobacterium sp. TaxID=239 RepID=UPI00391D9881
MKRLLFAFLLISACAFSQEADKEIYSKVSPTTNEEYKFLVAGLRDHIEKGTDMKLGYSIKWNEPLKSKDGNYKVNFGVFLKNDTNTVKGISIILQVFSVSYYLAIPINNDDLMKSYQNSLNELGETNTTFVAFALSKYLPVYLDLYTNMLNATRSK